MDYHIRTENLGKDYKVGWGSKVVCALKSLSIEIPASTIMGFLGKNGAGKTTTIKILLGLISATRGNAWLMGSNISETNARKHVSYMPESPALDNRDNAITFFTVIGQLCHIRQKEIEKRMAKVLFEVGLDGKEEVLFSTYSRGMKQRLELAQALFSEPQLLILDEPFSGLDPIGRIQIRDLIMRYNKENGMSVFFSSHILADVEVLCDSIAIIDHGELKAVGQKRDLLGLENIEISGKDVNPNGVMFLEKMCDHISRQDDNLSLFLSPDQDPNRIVELFRKYEAKEIKITEHYKNLEAFFEETVGN